MRPVLHGFINRLKTSSPEQRLSWLMALAPKKPGIYRSLPSIFNQGGWQPTFLITGPVEKVQAHPRNFLSPSAQVKDYEAAIKHCQENLGIDRFILWGVSFSGGHVINVAANQGAKILAVCALVPHLSPLPAISKLGVSRVGRRWRPGPLRRAQIPAFKRRIRNSNYSPSRQTGLSYFSRVAQGNNQVCKRKS